MIITMVPQTYPLYVVTDKSQTIGLVVGWGHESGSQPRPFVQMLIGNTTAGAIMLPAAAAVHYFVSRSEAEVYVRTVKA